MVHEVVSGPAVSRDAAGGRVVAMLRVFVRRGPAAKPEAFKGKTPGNAVASPGAVEISSGSGKSQPSISSRALPRIPRSGRLDRLELAAGLGVGQAHLVGVPVDHPAGEVLELGPAIQILEQPDLVALFLVLGPGERPCRSWADSRSRSPTATRGVGRGGRIGGGGGSGSRAGSGGVVTARRSATVRGRSPGRRRDTGSGPRRT